LARCQAGAVVGLREQVAVLDDASGLAVENDAVFGHGGLVNDRLFFDCHLSFLSVKSPSTLIWCR